MTYYLPGMPKVPRARTKEEVDNRIELWHSSPDDGVDLHDYLGWTWDEYAHWVMTGVMPNG